MSALPNMEAFWMPFSATKTFNKNPRIIASAKDMHYYDANGDALIDACAGLWCCNAGHCREPINEAVAKQAAALDFSPTFQYGHPKAFELASVLSEFFPAPLSSIFFTNSGSEAIDSALKIALAYHKIRGMGDKTMLIGRERGYHGVGFGGISVGGMVKNRMWFGNQLSRVAHLPHTALPENKFVKGQPQSGEHLADALTDFIQLHDASNIAAVVVEPVSGSAGVLPPPVGYLEKLRKICTDNDILLIFDEVICSFGRTGKKTGADYFGVVPDMMTFAKGVTSGTIPMGGVAIRKDIRETFLAAAAEHDIDVFHGYTYSGHPVAAAAGLATMQLYKDEGLLEQGGEQSDYFAEGAHSLRDASSQIQDIRTIGFMGAVDLPAAGGKNGLAILHECFHNQKMVARVSGDTIAISPPLIAKKSDYDEIFGKFAAAIKKVLG